MDSRYANYLTLKNQSDQIQTSITLLEQQKIQIADNFSFGDYFTEQPSLETIEMQQLEYIHQKDQLTEQIQTILQQLPSSIHLNVAEMVDMEHSLTTLAPLLDSCMMSIDTLLHTITQSRQKIDAGRLSELGDLLIERRNGADGGSPITSLIADGLSSFLTNRGATSTEEVNTQTSHLQNLMRTLQQILHQAIHVQELLLQGVEYPKTMELHHITGGKLTTAVEFIDLTQDYTQVFQKLFPRLRRTIDRASIASLLLQSSLKSQTTTLRDQLINVRTRCETLQQQTIRLNQESSTYRTMTGQTHP